MSPAVQVVDIPTMAYADDEYAHDDIIDGVKNAKVADANPVPVCGARKFQRARWTRIVGETVYVLEDALPIAFLVHPLQFLIDD